jgi:hypothetical protein
MHENKQTSLPVQGFEARDGSLVLALAGVDAHLRLGLALFPLFCGQNTN